MIPFPYVLRRRMMMCSGPFSFEYTGAFTDYINGSNRVIKFTSSGTLKVIKKAINVQCKLYGAGGAAAYFYSPSGWQDTQTRRTCVLCGGGSGGYRAFTFDLEPGSYAITAGASKDATAFGRTATKGGAAYANSLEDYGAGAGGSPNGVTGAVKKGTLYDDDSWLYINRAATGMSYCYGGAVTLTHIKNVQGKWYVSEKTQDPDKGLVTLLIPI